MGKSIRQVAERLRYDSNLSWSPACWLGEFTEVLGLGMPAIRRKRLHELRTFVFLDTVKVVSQGFYELFDGTRVDLALNPDIEKQTVFCESEIKPMTPKGLDGFATKYRVVEGDCLEFAHGLVKEFGEDKVCVLNMANWKTPGGGALDGAGAQEEYLFRCTDYYRSLYQYAEFHDQYGIAAHPRHHYPLNEQFGGVFSRGVTVFRQPEEEGYAYEEHPWKVNFIAVAAHRNPPTRGDRLVDSEVAFMENKVRTILRIALRNGQTILVLGALGCGAFHNPPKHVAEIFQSVLKEKEFEGVFEQVCFAIKEDHNSKGINYDTFCRVFSASLR